MTTLKLVTCDQHLVLQKQPVVASGDKNSVQVQIELCSMWDGFDVKVAFYKDGNRDFVLDIPLEDGACMVPPEMLDTPCVLNIGIWGKDASGRYKTSTMVKYRVLEGTPIEEGVRLVAVNDGTATEDQVLDGATFYAGDTTKKRGNIATFEDGEPGFVLKGDPGESAYDIEVKHGFKGTEEEWLASLKKPAEDAAKNVVAIANDAAENALKQAKESGEFDGKSAYAYAKDGGYTGTEEEFSAKLATPIVTPQMYGAVGDGVTDDTTAFENALAEHSCVLVPEGDYLITRPLDLTYKKSLVSEDGQNATLIYDGDKESSVILVGRVSVFRNINIVVKSLFEGVVFDTHNFKQSSNSNGKHSRVEHTRIKFSVYSPKAVLIGITVDSGTDPNNMPISTGCCYQMFHDVVVDGSAHYGTGIKMTLVQGRPFTEETKTGFPWITHIVYDNVYLGGPYTAIKAGVENTSGSELFNRVSMGHILFNDVSTQNESIETTRYYLDVNHIDAYFSKCIGWDYHHVTNDYGEKVNIIGEGANLCFCNCEMTFGQELLKCCDFTAEKDSGFTVTDNPGYFINKYFKGSFLKKGYDSVDAKIDEKMADAYIGDIAEEKMNEILYSGYINVLEDSRTQYKMGLRFSNSAQEWVTASLQMAIIIPVVKGGNIIRWSPDTYQLSDGYQSVFFFNDDELSEGIFAGEHSNLLVSDGADRYLKVSNPNGYKYVSIPFAYASDVSSETMIMTINRRIDGGSASYTEYLRVNVIDPAIPSWAKQSKKPTYTANEVGARPNTWMPSASDVGALASASHTTKNLVVTYNDGTSETVKLVVVK